MSDKTNKDLPIQVDASIVKLLSEKVEAIKAHEENDERLHDELWTLVHSLYPNIDKDANYELDATYRKSGVVMLKGRDKCDHDEMPESLKRMLGRIGKLKEVIDVQIEQVKDEDKTH